MQPEPEFLIREATVGDTEGIRRLQAESWLATYPNEEHNVSYGLIKEHTDAWLTPESLEVSKGFVERAINDPSGFYRVAEFSGEIVGFIHAGTHDDGTKELDAIYLRPDMFGIGLGRQLMELVMEWVGEQQVSLEVASYNQRAIRFYEEYGFKKVEGTEYVYKEMFPVVKMVREGASHE